MAINDIRGALVRGIDRVLINMRYREAGDKPLDEMIANVDIVELRQLQDRVIAGLSFTMESGEETPLTLPIRLLENP